MKIISFNVENLFFSPQPKNFNSDQNQQASVIQPGDKDFPLTKALAECILQIRPDIAGLMEVGGIESLESFNQILLKDSFHTSLIEGNSDRNIHLAYLINKKLNYQFEQFTHRNRKTSQSTSKRPQYMSRDIAELRVYDAQDTQANLPKLVILAVHLKSRRSDGADFGGQKRRSSEFNLLIDSYLRLHRYFGETVPILVMGDFNAVIHPEYGEESFNRIFQETDLVDILEVLNYPYEERATQTSFNTRTGAFGQQFDYIFVPKPFHSRINKQTSGLYLFKDQEGRTIRRPQSASERSSLPSDHYPLICDFDLT